MLTTSEIQHLMTSGGAVVTTDGDKIGTVTQVFPDDRTGRPGWVTVTTGPLGRAESYVPLVGASVRGDTLVVPYDAATVAGAPRVTDALGDLSGTEEAEINRYYGLG